MRSSILRALTATTALVSAMAGGAALADCQPDPAANGATVTCSATDADGFDAGAATNLTVNVLTGATVTTAAATSVVILNANSAITNAGLIVQTGANAGILLQGGSSIASNPGAIVASGAGGIGIASIAAGNVISNTGTITVSGISGIGIGTTGAGNVISNAGTITASALVGLGIFASGAGSSVTNTGTVTLSGANGIGIATIAASSTIVNSGTVTVSGGNGLALTAQNNANGSVTNLGTITAAGTTDAGVFIFGGNAGTLTNFGTITAIGPAALAFIIRGTTAATVTNFGAIRATGAGSIAVALDTASTGTVFTNAAGGLIFADAGANAVAIGVFGIGGTGVANNFGTIDGRMAANQAGLQVVNNGLIQITTGAVGQAHAVGAFTQLGGGTLALRVNAAAVSDTLGTNATTVLGGTLRAVVQPGLYNNATLYANVVTATAGLGGTQFASAVSTSPFFTASATYGANAANLTLTRIGFGAVPGLTQNQQAIGNALEGAYSTAATGAAATIFSTILGGTTVPFDGLSGEVGTGVQNPSFAMGDAFMGAISGQAQRWRAGMTGAPGTQSASMRVQFAAAQPTFELSRSYAQATAPGTEAWPPRSGVGPHWAAWASGFGLSGNRDGDGSVGSARLGYSMGGGSFGADVQLTPNLLLGGAIGGAGSDFSLDGRSASDTARAMFFALYGSWTMGPLYVDATATYGLASFSTNRIATQGTILERATGDFDGHQVGGRVEAGWRFRIQRYELTPFAGVTVQSLHQDAYSESSTNFTSGAPGILGLNYQAQSTTSVRSTLGAQAATTFQIGERLSLTPRLRAAWAHEFNDDRQVNASFLSIPGAAFTVSGARPARDAALVSAGVDVGLGRNVTVFAQFDSELAGSGNAYAGTGGLRVSW